MKQIIVRLSGALIFLLIGWGLLTLTIMVPFPDLDGAAWAAAGLAIAKTVLAFMAFLAVFMAWFWMVEPPKEFLE